MKSGSRWGNVAKWVGTAALATAVGAGLAYAKLPVAPMDDAAKAKADEAKAKAAEATKKAREAEEKSMDRVVERYKKEKNIKTSATVEPEKKKKK
jgi:hypothetical protein